MKLMWQKEYRKRKFYWGLKPTPRLKEAIRYAQKGRALDIGAGEGRNSLFLAKNSFKVTAIDIIPDGLKKLQALAKKLNLEISTQVIDVRKFKFPANNYSLIISVTSINFLKKSEVEKIFIKIKKSLIPEGIVFLSVFSTKDPLFFKIKSNLKLVEEDTFYLLQRKTFIHFFTKKELKRDFDDFEIILLKERCIKDILHVKPHFHHIIELIAKKET